MAALANKLKKILADRFKGAEVEIDIYPESDRIGATVVWKGFVGKDQIDRQRLARKAIEKALNESDARKIGLVITFTPDEMAAIREG